MATYVYLDNFRGFSNQWIPLKRVNFLVGENSTGKTSFIEVLEMFSHVPFWLFEPAFGVPGSHMRHFLDLVSATSKSKGSFTIGVVAVDEEASASSQGLLVTYVGFEGRPVPTRVSFVEHDGLRTIDGRLWISKKGERFRTRVKRLLQDEGARSCDAMLRHIVVAHHSKGSFQEGKNSEEMQGNPLLIRFDDFISQRSDSGGERKVFIPDFFRTNLVEVAPIRTKPRRTYDAPQTEFSPEGQHTPYLIKRRLSNKAQAQRFIDFLQKIGRESGLFDSVSVRTYGKGSVAPFELRVSLGKASLGLENVGYGVSQALPIVVEMFTRPRGTLFTIQQPEVHLHPKAQASVGDLIAQIAREDNKKFVVETHSDFTIDRFRLNMRRNGSIPSQLLFFERGPDGNRVCPIEILPDGSLPEDQPASYRDFFYDESMALLN